MTVQLLAALLLGIILGLLWSKRQRYLAVKEAFENIRQQVRRERQPNDSDTVTVFSFERF